MTELEHQKYLLVYKYMELYIDNPNYYINGSLLEDFKEELKILEEKYG